MADLCSGQDLRELLTRKGIVHGIDQEVLGYAAACIDRAETLTGPLLLASGTPAVFSWKGTQPRFAPSPLIIVEPDENGQIRQVEIALVPLIRKGELLTEQGRPTTPNTGRNIFGQEITCLFPGEQVVEPGENVTVDEASQQLIATASGYPVFTSTRKESLQLLHISIDRLIRTTPDRMQALLTLKPAPSGHSPARSRYRLRNPRRGADQLRPAQTCHWPLPGTMRQRETTANRNHCPGFTTDKGKRCLAPV